MKVITKRGELPSGAPKIIADAIGVSYMSVMRYIKDGFQRNIKGNKVKEFIEKNYPEFFEGTKIYILTVRTVFGKRMVLGACLKDDLKEMKDKLNEAGVDVDIEELVIGEFTDDARRTFLPFERNGVVVDNSHPICECIPRTKSGSILINILSELGCETLEEAATISPSTIMEGKGASKRTLFDLVNIFDKCSIEYDKASFETFDKASSYKLKRSRESIGMFDKEGNIIKKWETARAASIELGIPMNVIETRAKGIRKQAEDYTLKFIEEE